MSNEAASEIGYWTEIKLDILREYAAAYSRILSAQTKPRLKHVYIDGFCGSGCHMSRDGGLVWGSPTSVLLVDPPFTEYHLIDLDEGNIENLQLIIDARTQGPYDPKTVHLYNADCNEVLLKQVFPRVRYEDYRRALCLLDPYGLHLDWSVIAAAGRMRSIEIFLNFPILDMNRNVLHKNPEKVDPKQIERLTRYWGDDTWRSAAYTNTQNLFGYDEKTNNEQVVEAFRARLKEVAGFGYVSDAMPMRNRTNAVVYYLIFASHKPVAANIVKDIFKKHGARCR